ncbi:MAG: bifunctional phosphoglucose/phosphomannose isomerase, partial [Chitinophagia bacterium]|nr:bifunctional phosphoglucose/phosphomannose isomerase [Chitinophagia bacterium]
MKTLIQNFSKQLEEALKIGKDFQFVAQPGGLTNVVVSGLGGSGIGASIVQNYVFDKLSIPMIVNKDYSLPAFVSNTTLTIICSYSGNTEETTAALDHAIQMGAKIVCITSGGKVAETAKQHGIDCIIVPGGMPPRSCLGYSLVQLLFSLHHFNLIDNAFVQEIENAIKLLDTQEEDIVNRAQACADQIFGKLPIVYSASHFEGVAIRFRQQLNENSKMLAWHGAIPEMNHNELVGWRDNAADKAVILLRNSDDYERVQTRMEINKQIFEQYHPTIIEIYSQGNSYFEKA